MVYRKSISLALPFVFIWAWAACVVLCSETVTHHKSAEAESAPAFVKTQFLSAHCSEKCSVNSLPAAFHERQTVSAPFVASEKSGFPLFQNPPVFQKIFASDVNPHSPPKIVSARFLRLQNLRI